MKTERNEKDVSIECSWCRKSFQSAEELDRGVCRDCFELLRRSGIADEEIFGKYPG